MIIAESQFSEMLNRIARNIRARVEHLNGSTLLNIFTYDDALQGFDIERVGDANKFFGFGICQKITVKLRDKERLINIEKGQGLEAVFGVENEYLYTCPIFYIEEITRDENTNGLTIVAYDSLYNAANHRVSEMQLSSNYTIRSFAYSCGSILGLPVKIEDNTLFDVEYPTGANFEGTETIREALDDIAEATGTVYFINHDGELVFKKLDHKPVAIINKAKYFNLSMKTGYTLQSLTSATELGDNFTADSGVEGERQYIRDNRFIEIREDASTLTQNILDAVRGTTIAQFNLKWRGNFLLEPFDKIGIETKDGQIVYTYIFNDAISYTGGLLGTTKLDYQSSKAESSDKPSTVADSIRMTYAKVDRVNKTVEIVASEVNGFDDRIAEIEMDTESISASVSKTQKTMDATTESLNKEIETLNNKVDATMTSEDVTIVIQSELSKGINSVTTTTGFTFNEEGLTVTKTNSEMSTQITEDGMTVSKDGSEVLTANNKGVTAIDLHATTYLIIGTYSRLEDYGGRTACFWIG